MAEKLTAAKYCKQNGLSGLQEVAEKTGIGRETLRQWFINRRQLFEIIVKGCAG